MVTKVTAHIFYKYSKREEWGAMCAKSPWRHIDQQYWVLLLLLCCPKNTQKCLCYKVFVFFGFLIFWCFNYYSIKMACGSSSSETFTIIFINCVDSYFILIKYCHNHNHHRYCNWRECLLHINQTNLEEQLKRTVFIRVSHNTPFFELSYALLTSHAIGLEEATKKISAL